MNRHKEKQTKVGQCVSDDGPYFSQELKSVLGDLFEFFISCLWAVWAFLLMRLGLKWFASLAELGSPWDEGHVGIDDTHHSVVTMGASAFTDLAEIIVLAH